ncbi:DUF4058 family protein [Argonema antarcticum]|uniref:DUF4058 family protein n=1 Tax=Argonema antarcticum TaxID=2942763 RepID=UPI002011F9F5|nr:DUF4058 family protein [Argonema antarcticum]MCL1475187.1 DUF4058 family protein [Argonema antarcticum A004/B2]
MPSPFPGMNPYLENPELWSEVHNRLIVAIAIAIAPDLRPKYRVAIEKRTYLSDIEDSVLVGIPDVAVYAKRTTVSETRSNVALASQTEAISVTLPLPEEVRESYLAIKEGGTGAVVTVVEILSPKNKRSKEGRKAYESKRKQVLASISNLVEIDLLRSGQPMRIIEKIQSDYRILICRGNRRPTGSLYAFNVQDPIPSFPLPLQSADIEPLIELQSLLNDIYDQASFDMAIDYDREPVPKLKPEDAAWADELLRSQGLRGTIESANGDFPSPS